MMLVSFSKSPNVGWMYHLVNDTKHAGIISVNMFINVSCYSHQFLCTLSSPGGREAVQSQSCDRHRAERTSSASQLGAVAQVTSRLESHHTDTTLDRQNITIPEWITCLLENIRTIWRTEGQSLGKTIWTNLEIVTCKY